jgi:hypothetical protein
MRPSPPVYERTELTKARTSLAFAKRRLSKAVQDVQTLESRITALQEAEAI